MPWISAESKEREHSEPVRKKYAQSAQAHRQTRLRKGISIGLDTLVMLAVLGVVGMGLVGLTCFCVLCLLIPN